jgi:hypothetical protein
MASFCLAFGVFHIGPEGRFAYHDLLPETDGFNPAPPPPPRRVFALLIEHLQRVSRGPSSEHSLPDPPSV